MNLTNINKMLRRASQNVGRFLLGVLRKIPVISRLADCTAKDHAQALKEFSFALAFSTVTFWLSAVIMLPRKEFAGQSYWKLLANTVENGELLIFSVSFIGPIFLATLVDRPAGKSQFPGRDWHVASLCVVALIASALFSQLKAQSAPGAPINLDMDVLRNLSYCLAAGAGAMRYLTFVYQKNMTTLDEYGPKGDKLFSDSYIAHAEDKGQ
jgi:hypothetical protein